MAIALPAEATIASTAVEPISRCVIDNIAAVRKAKVFAILRLEPAVGAPTGAVLTHVVARADGSIEIQTPIGFSIGTSSDWQRGWNELADFTRPWTTVAREPETSCERLDVMAGAKATIAVLDLEALGRDVADSVIQHVLVCSATHGVLGLHLALLQVRLQSGAGGAAADTKLLTTIVAVLRAADRLPCLP